MRIIQSLLIAGVAAVACAGVAAMAASPQPHVLTIRLADGSVEQIRYTGDVAPQVALSPGDARTALFGAPAGFGPPAETSPFALIAQMSAQMDRQMAEMMRNPPFMPKPSPAGPLALQQAALGDSPAGTESYSVVSTFSGGKACTRSVQITSQGPDQRPHVVSQSSGDCAAQTGAAPQPAPTESAPAPERAAGKVTA